MSKLKLLFPALLLFVFAFSGNAEAQKADAGEIALLAKAQCAKE